MKIFNRRFLLLFVLPHVLFALAAWFTINTRLIGFFNMLNLAVAVMVIVAYAPVVVDVLLTAKSIERSQWLGLGIFLSWASTIELRAYSIVWRWFGQPAWLTDSDILSYALFTQLCAGILHLAAPGAISHRVPTRRWINIGIVVGLLALLALLLGYFFDALALD